MSIKQRPQTFYYELRTQLPTAYYTAIGRIVTRWAIIEYKLAFLVIEALGITPEEGRLILRGQRAYERATVFKDILELKSISLNIDWQKLHTMLREMESFRDRLAHNVWIHHPDSDVPVIQDLSAAYIKDLAQGHRPKIDPLAVAVPIDKLRNLTKNMNGLIRELTKLQRNLTRALKASQKESASAPPPKLLVLRRRRTQT